MAVSGGRMMPRSAPGAPAPRSVAPLLPRRQHRGGTARPNPSSPSLKALLSWRGGASWDDPDRPAERRSLFLDEDDYELTDDEELLETKTPSRRRSSSSSGGSGGSGSGSLSPQPRGHLGTHKPPADARPRVGVGLPARVEDPRDKRRAAGALGSVERQGVGVSAQRFGEGERRLLLLLLRGQGRERERRERGKGEGWGSSSSPALVLPLLLLPQPLPRRRSQGSPSSTWPAPRGRRTRGLPERG